ncbi:unnamed protein product, partial [Adineta ricciae]
SLPRWKTFDLSVFRVLMEGAYDDIP